MNNQQGNDQLPADLEALIDMKVSQRVKQELRELLGIALSPAQDAQPSSDWVDVNVAREQLGYPSNDALYRDVRDGLFRSGKEVRDRRRKGSVKPRYQFNLPACHSRLATDPSRRRGA